MSTEYSVDYLNDSSTSIVIREDLPCVARSAKTNAPLKYDLEVQLPKERAKILNDHEYFKNLSHSFYSDCLFNYRSFSSPVKPILP